MVKIVIFKYYYISFQVSSRGGCDIFGDAIIRVMYNTNVTIIFLRWKKCISNVTVSVKDSLLFFFYTTAFKVILIWFEHSIQQWFNLLRNYRINSLQYLLRLMLSIRRASLNLQGDLLDYKCQSDIYFAHCVGGKTPYSKVTAHGKWLNTTVTDAILDFVAIASMLHSN